MMIIDFQMVSKRYSDEWILKKINYSFTGDTIYGVKGGNGSGKSTLLKMASGHLSPSLGVISYTDQTGSTIHREDVFNKCTMWGPHVQLIPQLTISEMVNYFFTFKKIRNGLNKNEFYNLAGLSLNGDRQINSLSSGQTQRLGLALSILAESEILLLDEPGSFLDESSLGWLYEMIKTNAKKRLVIIASNEAMDLSFAEKLIDIADFK